MAFRILTRRLVAGALLLSALPIAAPVAAQSIDRSIGRSVGQSVGSPMTGLLAKASDHALTTLAQPGAFMSDPSVRILPPGPLRKMSGLMTLADKTGATAGLSKSINDAAGMAAEAAKPIFRNAIGNLSLKDAPGIAGQSDGATRYLRSSAGDQLAAKIRPIVADALGRTGAFAQLDRIGASGLLSGAGISRDGLTSSVTDQAMNGIFHYIGAEEAQMRANPMRMGKTLLGGLGH